MEELFVNHTFSLVVFWTMHKCSTVHTTINCLYDISQCNVLNYWGTKTEITSPNLFIERIKKQYKLESDPNKTMFSTYCIFLADSRKCTHNSDVVQACMFSMNPSVEKNESLHMISRIFQSIGRRILNSGY